MIDEKDKEIAKQKVLVKVEEDKTKLLFAEKEVAELDLSREKENHQMKQDKVEDYREHFIKFKKIVDGL